RLREGLRRVPDVGFVVAERLHLRKRSRFEGAPDIIWEIVAEDSVDRDRVQKLRDYAANGVREYWLIDPLRHVIELYALNDRGSYDAVSAEGGRMVSRVLPGFWLRPEWVVRLPIADVRECLRELGVTI